MQKIYKERRLYYFTCTVCGHQARHTFKRSRVKIGICKKCKRQAVDPNQQSLFDPPAKKLKYFSLFSGIGGFELGIGGGCGVHRVFGNR